MDSVDGLETGLLVLMINCYNPVDSDPPSGFSDMDFTLIGVSPGKYLPHSMMGPCKGL